MILSPIRLVLMAIGAAVGLAVILAVVVLAAVSYTHLTLPTKA